MRRIATEEAFSIPEIAGALREVARTPSQDSDYSLINAVYGAESESPLRSKLLDLEDERLSDMDANGVSMHLLSLTAPGVQAFDADTACGLAELANDRLAEVISRHPDRFAGLASFAPHAPRRAADEMARAIRSLHLNGFIVNSHTNNEYLDERKYWPVLEAAEDLGRCLYIHPRGPSAGLAGPLRDHGMAGAVWGFGLEVGTHAVRLILSGVLDRFPRLEVCIGHMGEAVPFWLWRIDNRWQIHTVPRRGKAPELTPSEYFKRNFVITTSGQENPLALDYSIRTLGVDSILWAIDYPYQPTAQAVSFMDNAIVTDEEREKLYHLNAERVFHIT
ncbi:MAG: amidohydrolase family protein [Acidimicrobiales bacterium]